MMTSLIGAFDPVFMRRARWYMFALPVLLDGGAFILILYYLTGKPRRRRLSVQYRFSRFAGYYWDRGH